jgi:hypothetical protein
MFVKMMNNQLLKCEKPLLELDGATGRPPFRFKLERATTSQSQSLLPGQCRLPAPLLTYRDASQAGNLHTGLPGGSGSFDQLPGFCGCIAALE